MISIRNVLIACAFATLSGAACAQEPSLPGNAASLSEGHGDWSVACALLTLPHGNRVKRCALSQQQISQETRQRALTIELTAEGNGAKGALVLPFGLALETGVTYQLDDGAIGAVQKFRTCLPVGCIVDVNFDAGFVASLQSGKVLKVKARADGGQDMVFSISLTGFSSAYDRIVALSL